MNTEVTTIDSAFSVRQKRWIVFLAAFAGWFSTLSSFIFFPAIPAISSSLGASIEEINLTVTSYLIVSAVVPSVICSAADIIGRRPVYLVALGVYFFSNIGLALQSSFPSMFALRMIQSAGVSGMACLIHSPRNCSFAQRSSRNVLSCVWCNCGPLYSKRKGLLRWCCRFRASQAVKELILDALAYIR